MARAPLPLPRRYLRALLWDIAILLAGMLLAVEALYLSDKVITHLLFDVLQNQLGLAFLLETIVLAAPEILAVGFPLAMLLAVYLALLRRREAGEFVILAAAGVAPRAVVLVCVALAVGVLVIWTPFRAYLEPIAARQLTIRLIEGRVEAVERGQLTPGQFLEQGALTFFQHPSTPERQGGVFAFIRPSPLSEEVVTGTSLRLDYILGAPTAALNMGSAQWLGLAQNTDGPERRETHRLNVERLRIAAVPIEVVDVAGLMRDPRASILPVLMERWAQGDRGAGQIAMERWLGIALATLAPMLAGLALALSRGRLKLLALPAALGLILGAGMGVSPLAAQLLALGITGALATAAGLALALMVMLAVLTARHLPAAILPQRPLQ